jgi:hypothetical protein
LVLLNVPVVAQHARYSSGPPPLFKEVFSALLAYAALTLGPA